MNSIYKMYTTDEIARNWMMRTLRYPNRVDDISYEISELLQECCYYEPATAWEIIINIVDKFRFEQIENDQDARKILENLAAGPLEDLLVYHGQAMIGEIEKYASNNKLFIWVIKMIWRNDIVDPVWNRILKIK